MGLVSTTFTLLQFWFTDSDYFACFFFGIFRYFFRVYDRYGLNALVYALTLVSFAAFLVFASDLNILERVFS